MSNNRAKFEDKIPNKWKKRIPNIITSSRILMTLGFIVSFLIGNMGLSVALFATASISDAMDGFLARRWSAQSKFGKYADPFADKLLVGSTLLLYGLKFNPLMFLPLIGELSIAGVNIISMLKNGKVDVNKEGKGKTISLMTTTSLALLSTIVSSSILNTIVQGLVFINLPLQAATLTGYLEQSQKKKPVENTKKTDDNINERQNKNVKSLDKSKDQLEILKREKEFLLSNNRDENIKTKTIGQKSKGT